MLQDLWKLLEGFAVLLYGAIAVILLFVAALWQGAHYATIATVIVAALTYLYQMIVLQLPDQRSRGAQAFAGAGSAFICAVYVIALLMLIGGI